MLTTFPQLNFSLEFPEILSQLVEGRPCDQGVDLREVTLLILCFVKCFAVGIEQ